MRFYIDIDDTVADTSHRQHFLTGSGKRWSDFFSPVHIQGDDVVMGAEQLDKLFQYGYDITFLTGRPERTREVTISWLSRHFPEFDPDRHRIIMKPDNSFEPANSWKVKQLQEFEEKNNFFVYIDDQSLNNKSVQRAFPNSQVYLPAAGWEYIRANIDTEQEPTVEEGDLDNEIYE